MIFFWTRRWSGRHGFTFPRLLCILVLCGTLAGCGLKPSPRYRAGSSPASLVNPSRMLSAINTYLGAPYLYGGDSRSGIDCSGLVMVVYRQSTGRQLPHRAARLNEMGIPVSRKKLRFGDLVFFNTGSREELHTGIYVGDGQFAHASLSRGVIFSRLDESYYQERYIGARRIIYN